MSDVSALTISILLALLIAGVLKFRMLARQSWYNSVIMSILAAFLMLFVISSAIRETQTGKFIGLNLTEKLSRCFAIVRVIFESLPLVHDAAADIAIDIANNIAADNEKRNCRDNVAYTNVKFALLNGCQ